MTTLCALDAVLKAQLADLAPKSLVPGYVAGVYQAGHQITPVYGTRRTTGRPL